MRFPLGGTISRCGPGSSTLTVTLGITTRLVMFDLSTWRQLIAHRGLDRLRGAQVFLDRDLLAFADEPGLWWASSRYTARTRSH